VSGFLRIEGGPEELATTGGELALIASEFASQVDAARAEILAIEAQRPWADDHFGRGFEHTYMESRTEGEPPLRQTVLDLMNTPGQALADLGLATATGMPQFAGGEATNAAEIKSAGLDA
jgi:hypothetical protein